MKKFLALDASAGSGKTYSLALRYIFLLFWGAKIEEILAVTFTNKAAIEMKDRIYQLLMDFNEDLANEISLQSNLSLDEIKRRKNYVVQEFLKGKPNITTIDSFIQQILRKFSYYAGIRSDFEVVNESFSFWNFLETTREEEFYRILRLAKGFKYWAYSFEEFLKIIYEREAEIDVETMGFKKTGDYDKDILKIYEELRELNPKLPEAGNVEDIIYTKSHSFKAWLKKETLEDSRDFKKCINIHKADRLFCQLKTVLKEYFKAKESKFLNEIFSVYDNYKKMLLKDLKLKNFATFRDIKYLVFTLLKEDRIDRDFFYFRLDGKISHILIDEFQDTSVEDWFIFEPLVDEIYAGTGQKEKRSFFYVGDIKQAIYGFRGGRKELFEFVKKRYLMNTENLNINYRSKSIIVDFLNNIFGLDQKAAQNGGYVEVCVAKDKEEFEKLKTVLEKVFTSGIKRNKIAILVHTNKEIILLKEFLETQMRIKANTSSSKKVIFQPYAKGVIDFIKYIFYKREGEDRNWLLLNFFSVANRRYCADIKMSIKKPVKMIKEICDKYNLWDTSTLLLLEEAINYRDIYEFVNKIEFLEKEVDTQDGDIEIMTIHKAKGLSFECVVVMDRFLKERNKKNKIIFKYNSNGIKADEIKVRFKDREYIDEEYKAVLSREKEDELFEKRNLAYVALTRAKDMLFVIKKEKSDTFSFLEEFKAGSFLDYREDKFSFKSKKKKSFEIKRYGLQEIIAEIESDFKENNYDAIYLGDALHIMFETDSLEYVKRKFEVFDVDVCKIENIYKNAKGILDTRFKGKRYYEIPFTFGDKKKTGVIDLLIENEDEIVIIDYKSSLPFDEKEYIKQVSFYKEAVSEMSNKVVKAYIFYLDKLLLREVK